MIAMSHQESRIRVKLIRRKLCQLRKEKGNTQSYYRDLPRAAKEWAERCPKLEPAEMKFVLRTVAVPEDYDKVVEHLGSCSPKTRRIADHALGLWEKVQPQISMITLKGAFFDERGKLKSHDIDALFREFNGMINYVHDRLAKDARIMKKDPQSDLSERN